jgi:hypothetical protein
MNEDVHYNLHTLEDLVVVVMVMVVVAITLLFLTVLVFKKIKKSNEHIAASKRILPETYT